MNETNKDLGSKERLEIKKLGLEVDNLNLAWWKKPSYLGVVLPVMFAFITLTSAWVTGYFDAERSRLKAEEMSLQVNVDNLNIKIARLVTKSGIILDDLKGFVDAKDGAISEIIRTMEFGGIVEPDSLKKVQNRLEQIRISVGELFTLMQEDSQ